MKPLPNLGKFLLWVAWIMFLVSLFLPMERHNVAGPCPWPCLYPFIYTVANNSLVFIFSPLLLVLNLFSLLFDLAALKTLWIYLVYSAIGIGEILMLLAPFLVKRGTPQWLGRSFLTALIISTLSILLYAWMPNLRYGIESLLIGYYVFLLSFIMMIVGFSLSFKMKQGNDSSMA